MEILFNSNCSPEGHAELVDAVKWVQETVPDFTPDSGPSEDVQYSAVAVLCQADYAEASSVTSLNHWVPALQAQQVSHAKVAMEEWSEDARVSWNETLKALDRRRQGCKDPILLASIDSEVEIQQRALENFLAMQKTLFERNELLCRHVKGDGNCGIYMLISMIQDIPMQEVTQADATKLRKDLSVLWCQLSSNPMYLKIWQVLRQFKSAESGDDPDPTTPDKKKTDQVIPFTPDKHAEKKRLLPADGISAVVTTVYNCSSPSIQDWLILSIAFQCISMRFIFLRLSWFSPNVGTWSLRSLSIFHLFFAEGKSPDNQNIVLPDDTADPPKKPKPSGKPRPVAERLRYPDYFGRWLSESGVIYKSWIATNRKSCVFVYPGCTKRMEKDGKGVFQALLLTSFVC